MEKSAVNGRGFILPKHPYLRDLRGCAVTDGGGISLIAAILPPVRAGMKNPVTLFIENRGDVCERRYTLKLRLENSEVGFTAMLAADCRAWTPGKLCEINERFFIADMEPGVYRVLIGLFDGDTPIKFAFDNNRIENGWAYLFDTTVDIFGK